MRVAVFNNFVLFQYWVSLTGLLVFIIVIQDSLAICFFFPAWKLYSNMLSYFLLFLYDLCFLRFSIFYYWIVGLFGYCNRIGLFLLKMNFILMIIFGLVFGFVEWIRRTEWKTTTLWTHRVFGWEVLIALSVRHIVQTFTKVQWLFTCDNPLHDK